MSKEDDCCMTECQLCDVYEYNNQQSILYSIEEHKFLLQIEKAKALKCGTFGASSLQQRYLATGDFDGRMQIWYNKAAQFFF